MAWGPGGWLQSVMVRANDPCLRRGPDVGSRLVCLITVEQVDMTSKTVDRLLPVTFQCFTSPPIRKYFLCRVSTTALAQLGYGTRRVQNPVSPDSTCSSGVLAKVLALPLTTWPEKYGDRETQPRSDRNQDP